MPMTSTTKPFKLSFKTISLSLVGLVLIGGLVAAMLLSRQEQDIGSKAAANTALTLSAATTEVAPGASFPVQVTIATGENIIQAIDLNISFPKDLVTLDSVQKGDFMADGMELVNTINNDSGTLNYTLGLLPSNLPPCGGNDAGDPPICNTTHGNVVATLNFTAKSIDGTVDITNAGVVIGAKGEGDNVLTGFNYPNKVVIGSGTAPTDVPAATATPEPTNPPAATATPTQPPAATATPTQPAATPPAEGADTTISLVSSANNVSLGGTFTVTVQMNTGTNIIQAADLNLSFPANLLSLQSVTKGDFMADGMELVNNIDNNGGTVNYTLGLPPSALPPCGGNNPGSPAICTTNHGNTLATLTFVANSAGSAVVNNAATVLGARGESINVLASFNPANIQIGDAGSPTATPTQSPGTTPPACGDLRADFNNDCRVGSADYNYLMARYLKTGADAMTADISGPQGSSDGKVDIWDYTLLTVEWTGD